MCVDVKLKELRERANLMYNEKSIDDFVTRISGTVLKLKGIKSKCCGTDLKESTDIYATRGIDIAIKCLENRKAFGLKYSNIEDKLSKLESDEARLTLLKEVELGVLGLENDYKKAMEILNKLYSSLLDFLEKQGLSLESI